MRLPPKVAVIAVAVLAATACSSGSKADPVTTEPVSTAVAPPSTTTLPTTTTVAAPPPTTAPTTTLDPKAEVIAAYEAYFEAADALLAEPKAISSAFDQLMTGRQRAWMKARIQERIDGRFVTRWPTKSIGRHATSLESLNDGTAVLVACIVDDSYRFHLDTGEITNAETSTFLNRVTLVRDAGRWKVEDVVLDRTWDGVAGCAA